MLLSREVSSGGGWSSPNDLRVHFGLGNATRIDSLEIRWPSGIVQKIAGLGLNKIHQLVEPPLLSFDPAGKLVLKGAVDILYTVETSVDLKAWNPAGTAKGGESISEMTNPDSAFRYYRLSVK